MKSPRGLLSRVVRWVLVTCLCGTIGVSVARPAYAHDVFFTIWGYGITVNSGTDNHYWRDPMCPTCAWDYYFPTNEDVYQDYAGQGNFFWDTLHLPGGATFSGGFAMYGHNTFIENSSGTYYYVADLFCQTVTAGSWVYAGDWNGDHAGTWFQDSGWGPNGNCAVNYNGTDHMSVQAGN